MLRFKHLTIDFEIPDDWLRERDGLCAWIRDPKEGLAFTVMDPPYPSDPQGRMPQVKANIVSLTSIEPVVRILPSTGTPFESREKLLGILAAMMSKQPLPPIHTIEASGSGYGLKLYNGMHRFLSSIAAGFTHIPVVISPRYKVG